MNIDWDAKNYKNNFSFVHKYGEDVLSLITAKENSFVVDLGCGNGALTKKLSEKYTVLGIDSSDKQLTMASIQYPYLTFKKDDALTFQLHKKADVIFSNAVFHWIDEEKQQELLQNIYNQLKENGELVCEFGGHGCAESIHSTLEKNFNKKGYTYPRTFYFPTIGQYASLLEQVGFTVEYATLFDRPTKQQGDNGLENWIQMFNLAAFKDISETEKEEIIQESMEELKEKLYIENAWYVDYVRIRIRARKK